MSAFDRELKAYKKQIRRLLLIRTAASKQFSEDLESDIAAFAEAKNVTSVEEIAAHFGTPEQIARAFFAGTDIEAVRKKLNLRRAVIAVLLASLLLWGAALTALYVEARSDMHGTYVETAAVSQGEAP
ncbi:MAG: hypothetical protein IJL25_09430 [Clostridia bacterium]|nr:hypothetical protein [Clostridia bacterium]